MSAIVVVEESRWSPDSGWQPQLAARASAADLVIYFGSRDVLRCADRYHEMRSAYPRATIVGCSATRSISGDVLDENVLVAVALRFTGTRIAMAHSRLTDPSQSRAAGETIGKALAANDLAAVLVLADGLRVDGTDLTGGLCDAIGAGPLVIGGMASDPRDYQAALVGADGVPESGLIAAVGFYGGAIRFTNGCASGWDAFGPSRRVTRSARNVLYELDGKPPYELYERYLGEELSMRDRSDDGVVFPLQISHPEIQRNTLVRAPLAIDGSRKSMTFAGHIPEGWTARLMRGNADRLIFAAADAARQARPYDLPGLRGDSLALIVSCAGRHQVMGQRTEEELEVVGAQLDRATKRIGFYSFGEIAPIGHSTISEVHNQTISVTSIAEFEG